MTTGRARMIDVDGPVHVVEYADGGGGPPVVCVHGLGGSAADWQLLAPRLTPDRRVYALDLPGFGVSPLGGRTATIQRLRVLLDRFIHEQVGEPVVLVGNSMGGMLALLQAARCRASVDRLVLLSPVVPTPVWRAPHLATVAQFMVYALPALGEWFVRVRRRRIAPAALVAATLAHIAADVDRIPRSIVDERTALAPRRAGDATGDRAFLAAARSLLALLGTPRRYRRELDRIEAPVLVVHGDRDRLVSIRAVRAFATARPRWRLVVLDGVGHVPQLEAVDEVADVVRSWLRPPTTQVADFPALG
ncbi:alpha/beta fold hydrolase [soil metagenome]